MKKVIFLTTIVFVLIYFSLLVYFYKNYLKEKQQKHTFKIVLDNFKPIKKFVYKDVIKTNIVHVTVYNALKSQCNEDVIHTAFMFKLDLKNPYKHKIVAVSRDLLKDYPNGTKIKISGTDYDGIYTVRDKMNKRFKKRIDILINKDMKIGCWENIVIEKV